MSFSKLIPAGLAVIADNLFGVGVLARIRSSYTRALWVSSFLIQLGNAIPYKLELR